MISQSVLLKSSSVTTDVIPVLKLQTTVTNVPLTESILHIVNVKPDTITLTKLLNVLFVVINV